MDTNDKDITTVRLNSNEGDTRLIQASEMSLDEGVTTTSRNEDISQKDTSVTREEKLKSGALEDYQPLSFFKTNDFIINESGDVVENWSKTELIPSKLIEVNDETAILECLIDFESPSFQLRKFPKNYLEGKIPFITESYLIIKVYSRPGKVVYEFIPDNKLHYKKYFDIDENLDNIKTGAFIK